MEELNQGPTWEWIMEVTDRVVYRQGTFARKDFENHRGNNVLLRNDGCP